MKRLWRKFLRLPGYIWLFGLIGVLFLDQTADVQGNGAAAWFLWGIAWFFLLATILAALAAVIRLVRSRGRGAGWRQIVFAVIGLLLVGFVATRLVAGGERGEIEDVLERVLTENPRQSCYEDVTNVFLAQMTNSLPPYSDDLCVEGGASLAVAEQLEIGDLDLTDDGHYATVIVEHEGGALSGTTGSYALIKTGDHWRVHRHLAFLEFDRDEFVDGFREYFAEGIAGGGKADCAVRMLLRYSDRAIESSFLDPRTSTGPRIAVRCARPEFERLMLAGFDSSLYDGLPERVTACARATLSEVSDRELAHLYDDVEAFGLRLVRCGRDDFEELNADYIVEEGDLDSAAAGCVSRRLERMSAREFVRFGYDQEMYADLLASCPD